ncbi:Smr domain-containing protein C11H11.03c [Cladophialophora carrionii]|uniref:Smr domain-containing protein C11H11.03c n=1 Tax=Cladophialophora carrionii TaxID=86049 RepID=A0A1C1CHF8_9EURO|nr:Smr domain-containing protein C11H11.03c [Cladophialophora carrionii]
MSYEMSTQHGTRVGARPFNHNQSQAAEQEYDRLRNLARQEASKRANCFQRSQQAYQDGDGAAAHALSQEGKEHGAKMEMYNKQASEFIFRENNAGGRVPADTIDLHGQFVEEAEDILEERIRYAQSHGQTHLHVIVGKGNHSANHVQKIKPRVEQVCQQLGLQYSTEENEGRIYVKLDGSPVEQHDINGWGGYQHYPGHQPGYSGGQQEQQYHAPPQQHQQQHGQYAEAENVTKGFLPRLINKLLRMLCGS